MTSTAAAVHGDAEAGFGGVADAFRRNLAEHGEIGAACCLYVGGRPVVDVWGGIADPQTGRPWEHDTLVLVFSTTKGITAVVVNRLIEEGVLDPDTPVASYWPEFAANGKADLPLRFVLSHRAGLPIVEGAFTLDEALAWEPVVAALASQAPRWEPGTAHGYHFRTYGWLLGEVVRRVTGRTIGQVLARDLARPLGLEVWVGLPEALEARVAAIVPPEVSSDPELVALAAALTAPDTLLGDAMTGPSNRFRYDQMWNTRPLHACELPSSNGIADARSIARLYAATVGEVDGVRVLAPETVAAATVVEAEGPDRVVGLPMRYGRGFGLGDALVPSALASAFGHPGAGGSLGLADLDCGIGFGYVMNRMRVDLTDPRADSLVRATYDALG